MNTIIFSLILVIPCFPLYGLEKKIIYLDKLILLNKHVQLFKKMFCILSIISLFTAKKKKSKWASTNVLIP